jgi:hypothetical protein
MYFCVVLCILCFVTFPVFFVCICVLNYYHRVAIQLQLNISYHIVSHQYTIKHQHFLIFTYTTCVGRRSSVGIATGYGLDDQGIEFRWGRDFTHLSRPALGPAQPPVQ